MATINPTDTLELPVDRQDLFNVWSTAQLGSIPKAELSAGLLAVEVGSDLTEAPTSPTPGQLYFSAADKLMFVWTDVLEGTGVSLWLAIGPDRFDTACLTDTAVPAGALVKPTYDRRVATWEWSGSTSGNSFIGCNQAGIDLSSQLTLETAATDTWIPVAIDGIMYGLLAEDPGVSPDHYSPEYTKFLGGAELSGITPGSLLQNLNPSGAENDGADPDTICGLALYNTVSDANGGKWIRFAFNGYRHTGSFW